MRVVLKPGGFLLILTTLLTLTGLLFVRYKTTKRSGLESLASVSASTASGSAVSSRGTKTVSPGSLDSAHAEQLLKNGDFSENPSTHWQIVRGKAQVIREKNTSGLPQYLRMQFVPEGDHFWSVNMNQSIDKPLKAGDRIEFRGWLRSPESVVLNIYVEAGAPPYTKFVSGRLSLTPEWKEYSFVQTLNENHAAGETKFNIHFGVIPGAVAMANFKLNNYGGAAH